MAQVLFVNTAEKRSIRDEVNGTMLLATKLLQAGIDAQILRFCEIDSWSADGEYLPFIRDITEQILQRKPKCVSFYTLWPYYHILLRIAREVKLRDPQIITVMGGPQASATAEETLRAAPWVDYVCTGEGENTVVPFFTMLLKQDRLPEEIPALYYRKDGKVEHTDPEVPLCDLNTLPYWDDRLYSRNGAQPEADITSDTYFMPIDAGRGCPFSCTFCCTSHFWRRTYRLKSPERIIDDILYYNQKFGIRSFFFSHDAFTTDRKLVEAVCDKILEKGLDICWKCTTRIDCISKELILKMQKAGMTHIDMGVETGSERMQKLTNKRLKLATIKEMVEFLLQRGLHISLFFMYGFPEETEQDLNETLELLFSLLDMGVHQTTMSFCRFNPNTAITEEYLEKLVLDPSILVLSRKMPGYKEEWEMIEANRAIFPFFYHLETPVRREYQYLSVLENLYRILPGSIRFLRQLYHGDNLKFYRDFISCLLQDGSDDPYEAIGKPGGEPLDIVHHMLDGFDVPYAHQLKELMRYDDDCRKLSRRKDNFTEERTYGFSYLDLKRKLPIERYHEAETTLSFRKDGKDLKIRMIDIR